jgi:hypothetical protein
MIDAVVDLPRTRRNMPDKAAFCRKVRPEIRLKVG